VRCSSSPLFLKSSSAAWPAISYGGYWGLLHGNQEFGQFWGAILGALLGLLVGANTAGPIACLFSIRDILREQRRVQPPAATPAEPFEPRVRRVS
jgi:hypothetical protein